MGTSNCHFSKFLEAKCGLMLIVSYLAVDSVLGTEQRRGCSEVVSLILALFLLEYWKMGVLVIYCCVTHYPFKQLKTSYIYHLEVSVSQESWCSLAGDL